MGLSPQNPVHTLKQRDPDGALHPRASLLRGAGAPEPPSLKSPNYKRTGGRSAPEGDHELALKTG